MSAESATLADPFHRFGGDQSINLQPGPVVIGVQTTLIAAGVYTAFQRPGFFGPGMPVIVPMNDPNFNNEGTFDLGGPTQDAVGLIRDFMTNRKERVRGVNSVAIVMHGPPGNGKTRAANFAVETAIKENGAIVLRPRNGDRDMDGWKALHACSVALRAGGVTAPIVWHVDDVPQHMWENGDVEEFLIAQFDGRNAIDGVLLVATTNFGHKMPERFAGRVSRCMQVFFGPPTKAMLRRCFVELGVTEEEMPDFLEAMKGKSLDQAASLVASVRARGISLAALALDEEMRLALRDRNLDYGVAMERLYGEDDIVGGSVRLKGGKVFNATGAGELDEKDVDEEDGELQIENTNLRLLFSILVPGLTSSQLDTKLRQLAQR